MVTLDIDGVRSRTIGSTYGLPDQELASLRTPLRRATEQWLHEREEGEHDWAMDPYRRKAAQDVKELAAAVKKQRIQTVIWIGIGGSGLGPRVLQEAFEVPKSVEFIVLDSIDPHWLQTVTSVVDWNRTLVVVVSKSGGTLESMSAFFLCWEKLKQARKGKAKDGVVAITDPKAGALRTFCLEQGIRTLSIPPNVGGRYCIFSPVGLFTLALLDRDVDAFLRGAKAMDTRCQSPNLDENPAAQLAAVQWLLDTKRRLPVRVIMPYGHRLQSMGRWDQQLVAESLGKNEFHNPVPLAGYGTQDQHSLLQQWLAGPRISWHLFLREAEHPSLRVPDRIDPAFQWIAGQEFGSLLDACTEGTAQALTQCKRPHATLTLERLDETNLGEMFFLFMAEVVLLSKLYRIDPYGQPAVEIGKVITKELLTKPQA